MRLIITEKPSMGRDVAAALGATRRGEGFIDVYSPPRTDLFPKA